jgi:RNA recognition motif-containing protein
MSVTPVEKGASAEAAANDAVPAAAAAAEGTTVQATDKSSDDAKAAADAAAISAAEGRRLYIGNLAYAASEADIKEFFSGYLVEAVTIPKNPRTDKAVGYAFVDLSTPTESERAIQELAGKEILERKVSVQIAHRPEAAAEKKEGEGAKRAKGSRGRNRSSRGRGRKTEGEGAVAAAAAAAAASLLAEGAAAPDGEHPAGEAAPNNSTPSKPREKRAPSQKRERGPPADGVPSKTKVMVANLPYDLDEDKLKELFAAYEPISTKIALRPIPRFMIKKLQARNEPRKGRGFGFVTLPSEELQQQAVAEMNGTQIEGREIAVKVAVDSPDKTDEALAAKAAAAAAATEDTAVWGDAAEAPVEAPAAEAPAS